MGLAQRRKGRKVKSLGQKKQRQTYLRVTDLKLGYLLNFGETLMKKGITRAVNGPQES